MPLLTMYHSLLSAPSQICHSMRSNHDRVTIRTTQPDPTVSIQLSTASHTVQR